MHRLLPSTMRAAVLSHFGGPEVIRVMDNLPLPRCSPHEVLVKVRAAAVNPLDCRIREGYGRAVYQPMLPLVLGRDVSGEVVAAGSSARAFPLGTAVFGALSPVAPSGTHAEYVAVAEAHLSKKPSCLTHEEASAIPFAALTAWRALFASGELRPGERVLIMGGGSSVGTAAAQLALAKGCQVAATCGPRSRARLASLGVTQLADYTAGKAGAVGRVARDEGWAPFDVALDTVGTGQSERGAIGLLRKGTGRYVTLHGQLAELVGERGVLAGECPSLGGRSGGRGDIDGHGWGHFVKMYHQLEVYTCRHAAAPGLSTSFTRGLDTSHTAPLLARSSSSSSSCFSPRRLDSL